MKSRNHLLVIAVLIIVSITACGQVSTPAATATPLPPPTQTPIPPTATAIPPTPTQTPFPISELELDSLLVQDGDLPTDVNGADIIYSTWGTIFEEAPAADRAITQLFTRSGNLAGFVIVSLYQDESIVTTAHDVVSSYKTIPVPDIGEKASLYTDEFVISGLDPITDLSFIRCHSVVYIRFQFKSSAEEITSYAKKLDARLAEVACP